MVSSCAAHPCTGSLGMINTQTGFMVGFDEYKRVI